jgi:serine/threonine protein kinase
LKIVHQNIKLENILLDSDGHIRLSGFGKSFYKLLKNNNIKMKVNND